MRERRRAGERAQEHTTRCSIVVLWIFHDDVDDMTKVSAPKIQFGTRINREGLATESSSRDLVVRRNS